MNTLSYKTVSTSKETAAKKWLLVDAEGQTLGRLASKVAYLLRGKHKTNYTDNADCGDYVIVVNASKIQLTGDKWDQKYYVTHTGYPGGQREFSPRELMAKHPGRVVERAIKGMLPKSKLGSAMFRNLKIYADANHGQEAQKPTAIKLESIK